MIPRKEDVELCAKLCVDAQAIREGDVLISQVPYIQEFKQKQPIVFNLFKLDVAGVYTVFDNKLIICFQGSSGFWDWIYNFMAGLVDVKSKAPIKTHTGFLNQFEVIQKDLVQIVSAHKDKVDEIWFTGHSLGGAISSIAALFCQRHLKLDSDKVLHVVFGAPKVGNDVYAEKFNKRIPHSYSFKNGNDFLAKLPPEFFGYREAGKIVNLKSKKFPWINPKDHFIKTYLKEIEAK